MWLVPAVADMLDQLEFRWTARGRNGYSVVAASDWTGISRWEHRLQPLARPPVMPLPVTVVYHTFGAEAAILFRRILRPAAITAPERGREPGAQRAQAFDPAHTGVDHPGDSPQPDRKALVARAVVGPVAVLTPEIALGCAAFGLPGFLDPPLGEKPAGDHLPKLASEELRAAAAAERLHEELDSAAKNDPALAGLVAAVLAWPKAPVVLQVPHQLVGSYQTMALLWGLWRLTAPVLRGDRNWTFSTGEQPLGNADPGELPHLVVRSLPHPGDPRPDMQRDGELVIQPQTPTAALYGTEPVAQMMVGAYTKLPVSQLLEVLGTAGGSGGSVPHRLAIIQGRLHGFRPQVPPGRDGHGQDPPRSQSEADDCGRPMPYQDHEDPVRDELPGWLNPAMPVTADRAPADARPPGPRPLRHRSDRFGRLFAGLAEGNPGTARDLLDMAAEPDRPGHQDRVALRREATRHGWFVRQFARQHPREVERHVRALLALIVEPDLANPACRGATIQELSSLMADDSAPDVVLMALDSLVWERRDPELQQHLILRAGLRWLAERGRYGLLDKPRAPAAAHQAQTRGPWWLPFQGRSVRIPALLAIAALCALVIETAVIVAHWG